MSHKFTVELGGKRLVFEVNVRTIIGYEKLAGKSWLASFDINSYRDVACFLTAALYPRLFGPMMLEGVTDLLPLDRKAFAEIQLIILQAFASVRGVPMPAEAVAALRAEIEKVDDPAVPQADAPPAEIPQAGAPSAPASSSGEEAAT